MKFLVKMFTTKCLLICTAFFGFTLSIYVPNEIAQTPRPYTTGLKIKMTQYKALTEPYYHSNYSKVYVHNKNYTSSLLDATSTDSHSQASRLYPVYISEEKKEKIKNVLAEHNTNVVERDTLNNRVVYKRRIDKSKNIEVFNRCPRGVSGQFVYDLACNQYLDCWKGKGGPRNCAPGTLFNPKTLECDFPEKVECLTGLNGNALTLQRSAKLQSPHEQAKCPQDFSGLIPNYTDCSKFVQCNNGIQTARDCPPGTLFDTNLNVCNHASETACFSGQSYGIKEEFGGSTDGTDGFHSGAYRGQVNQFGSNNLLQSQGGHQGQGSFARGIGSTRPINKPQDYTAQYQHADQKPPNQFYSHNNHHIVGHTRTTAQATLNCDPTNPYCQSGGYIISGHNVYNMYPQRPQDGSFNNGRDARRYSGSSQSQPCNSQLNCKPQQGTTTIQGQSQGGRTDTVYVQYVMCNPSAEDCTTFQQGTYMLGPSGALCNPTTQQCGQRPAYIPSNQMSASNAGRNRQPASGTYFVKYIMCDTVREDCSQYQKGVIEAAYGVPGTLIGARPVEESGLSSSGHVGGCNPIVQNCGPTQHPPWSFDQVSDGQPCNNPQLQGCVANPQGTEFQYQGQQRPSVGVVSGQSCNPQGCIANPQGTEFQYQGQQRPSVAVGSQISGSHGKSGQPCNPLYQRCTQSHGGTYVENNNCNPQIQNCDSVAYQGQSRPSISSYGHQTGTSNIHGYAQPSPRSGYYPQITHHNSTTNYKKVCTAGDVNCYRTRPDLRGQTKASEAKCPQGFQGVTRHPTNCAKFLNCANGITYIQDCGPGTLFNPILSACDFPYNVDCHGEGGESTTLEYPYNVDQGQQGSSKTQGCQGRSCQGQAQNQGGLPVGTDRGQYGQGQSTYGQSGCQGTQCGQTYPGQYQESGYGAGANNECVGSQCTSRPSGHTQYRCRGSGCGQQFQGATATSRGQNCQGQPCESSQVNQGYPTLSPLNKGQAGCQGHQCGSSYDQGRVDGGPQVQDYGAETTIKPYTWQTGRPSYQNRQGHNQGQTEESHVMRIPAKTDSPGSQPINKPDRATSGGFNNQRSIDYVDIFDPDESKNLAYATTTPTNKPERQVWPPPFPDLATTDVNADYVFEYEDGEPVTLAPENVQVEKRKKSRCGDNDFMCTKRSCIAKNFVCDGVRDCDDGKDEKYCQKYLDEFKPYKNSRLDVLEKQRWNNVSYSTCALLCMDNQKFVCKSFNYRKVDKACFLTNENVGSSGALKDFYPCDYYERKSTSLDCSDMHKCPNGKCLTSDQICDGYDDCGDRADERGCQPEDFGYSVRLAAGEESHEGRIEVTVFGKTGYICDDQFSLTDADVLCKELGFVLGALEVKGNSFFARDLKENNTQYMMDDIECIGNETSVMQCNFAGWGIHNCADREIAGVVCKTPQETCSEGYWKCDTGNECVSIPFVCDGLDDCTDNSDEADHLCDSPTALRLVNGTKQSEGRLEVRHKGIWGSVCDDDFNEDAAKIVCKSLGYSGSAVAKKDAFFGESLGPIWLDQVSCKGNETSLEKCTHWDWGEHNCDHSEDVGIVCSNTFFEVEPKRGSGNFGDALTGSIGDLDSSHSSPEPVSCGYRKDNIFLQSDDVHFRVVQGSLAKPGDYPWQAALRIKGQQKSAHWCGAVVIAAKWVLTAAHCLEGYPKGSYVVVAGEYNIDENEGSEQQAFIEEYYLHENFRKGHKMGNDIAMILLKGKGFRLNQDIQPICLPDETADYERDLNCTISGFGTIQTGKSAYSHKLRAAWIPIQKMGVCKMAHIYGESIGEGMICAGDLTGGIDACDGDSGGPLACLDDGVFTLYGLTSWGHRCGYANKPGVYVKVSHYKKWIERVMEQHSGL